MNVPLNLNSDLAIKSVLTDICSARDAALRHMEEAVSHMEKGQALMEQAEECAKGAHSGAFFSMRDRSKDQSYRRLFTSFDGPASRQTYRQYIDARVWIHLMTITGMNHMMDRTAKDKFYEDLCGEVPEVSEDMVRAVFESLQQDAGLMFQRGLARCFSDLDRRFKSHDAFSIGSRIILTHCFDQWGHWNFHSHMRDTIADIERVFAVLDGKTPEVGALAAAISKDRERGFAPHQSVTMTPYFKIKVYKNGNAHLWFQRDDLVRKANKLLAEFYGEVLPDAVPDDMPDSDLRSTEGALSKDLAFYPTPEKVAKRLVDPVCYKGMKVLEPSAGTGHIVKRLIEKGAVVDAVEVHPDRVKLLESVPGVRNVTCANFLKMAPVAKYDGVFMNPPFYGTHWMQHVRHAFDFLKPGGSLHAILPISAELGQTKKHQTFRKWAKQNTRYGRLAFNDLPAESFVESGTRVNTVTLTLYKARGK